MMLYAQQNIDAAFDGLRNLELNMLNVVHTVPVDNL